MIALVLVLGVVLAAAFMAAAVGAIWWAVFGDKSRGRRRCPRCWHDLSRTAGLTCGECGFTARAEAELGKARRRWGSALAVLAAVVAVAVWVQASVLNRTWTSYLPNAFLAWLPSAIDVDQLPREVVAELQLRAGNGELAADDLLALIEALTSDGHAPGLQEQPRTALLAQAANALPDAFDPVPGEPSSATAARDGARRAFESARNALLDRLPPSLEAVPLEWFPRGAPALVGVRGTVWGSEAQWRMREVGSDGPWIVGDRSAGLRRTPRSSVVPVSAVPEGDVLRCEFRSQVRRRSDDRASWGPWTEGPRVVAEGPAAPIDLAGIVPVDDAPAREAAARCFGNPLIAWADDQYPIALRFSMSTFGAQGLGDLLVGIRIELREGAVPRRRSLLWWSGDRRSGWIVEWQDAEAMRRLRDAIARSPRSDADGEPAAIPGWSLHVEGDAAVAIRALAGDPGAGSPPKAWVGTLELPVRGEMEAAEGARRTYWLEPDDAQPRTP